MIFKRSFLRIRFAHVENLRFGNDENVRFVVISFHPVWPRGECVADQLSSVGMIPEVLAGDQCAKEAWKVKKIFY